ncbi:MAG TPA: metal-dependent hydrolase [Saliniramus sp.]|nr:metal-dependent hydrolase [Saliniramus sp.]
MDTITQILLGAAVGHAVGGRRLGWLAPAAGAAGGLIPDLDVFWPTPERSGIFWDVHRGITHSLFFGPVVGGALGWISARLHARSAERRDKSTQGLLAAWCAVWILAMFTHPLLDFFTVYGTQLLAPFSHARFALPAIPIIDPVYTLILVVALVMAWRIGWKTVVGQRVMVGALVLTTSYLFVAWGQHYRALDMAQADAGYRERAPDTLQASTTMFTPWLRRLSTEEETTRHVGFVSTINPKPINWVTVERDMEAEALLDDALSTPEGVIYRRFASGLLHPHIIETGDERFLRVGDMRYGSPGATITGMWGLEWPLDGEGRIAGEGLRYRVSPEATPERIKALFRASFGMSNGIF